MSRYDSIHFSPDYWTWSRLPGSPPKGGAHAAYMRQHGTGLHIYEMDGFYAGFSTISGYQKGLHFERGVSGMMPVESCPTSRLPIAIPHYM